MTQVVHAIDGRFRLRVPALKGNEAMARDLEQRLGTLPGVLDVRANARTGSVLVHHFPAARGAILAHLDQHLPGVDAEQFETRRRASGGPSPWLPYLFAGLGIADLARRAIKKKQIPVPNWYDFLWFGLSSYWALRSRQESWSPDSWNPEASDR